MLFRAAWSKIKKMKEKPTSTRKLGKLFYIILIALTAAMLALLGVWAATKKLLFLYILIGIFPLYLFHLVFHLVRTDKDYKKRDAKKSEFLAVARDANAGVVYITYLGNEKRVKKPSPTKKDYLVEFYTPAVDLSLLKRHLWFDLPEKDEETLIRFRIGQLETPFPFLEELTGRKLLVQAAFYNVAKDLPHFQTLLNKNEVLLYDE